MSRQVDERVLIMAPVGRDAALTTRILQRAGFSTGICPDLPALSAAIAEGAGAVLLTQEALRSSASHGALSRELESQPAWSALPLVVITNGQHPFAGALTTLRWLEDLRSATFLERPVRIMTLVSTLRTAIQARRRQYQVRDLLAELERGVRYRDEFLAMLAHELRNPLAPIRNAAHLLQLHRNRLDARLQWAADAVDRQSNLLTRLVDDLLDVARITRGMVGLRLRELDLGEVIDQAVEAVQAQLQGSHPLSISISDECRRLHADPARLTQIVFNLLHNAGKYSDPGRRIWLSVYPEEPDRCAIAVRDEGRGIAREHLDTIFELFLQGERGLDRAEGGLGLGLTLVRRLTELHGGSVSAHSEGPGKGSEFIVHLPRREQPSESANPPEPSIQGAL